MARAAVEAETKGMAAIGLSVSVAAALLPGTFFRTFGITEEPSGAAKLGWRLFAVRTATISVLAASGNRTARDTFVPVQLMDQATWWWGYSRRELPLRTAVLATVASGAIVALDLKRRTAPARPRLGP